MQDHPKFREVAEVAPLLFSRELQMGEEKLPKPTTLGSAVSAGEGRWGGVILHSL